MLPYFLLGLAVLAGAFLAIRWFVQAEPAQVVKALRWALIVVAVVGGLFLIFAGRHVLWIKPALNRLGCAPLAAYHYVVSRLIPEVVVKLHSGGILLPSAHNLKLVVQQQKSTRSVARGIAQH